MLEHQDMKQIEHYTRLRIVLDRSMVLGSPKREKYKQGYVTVQSKDGKWVEQFIILSSTYLVGYRLNDKVSIFSLS